MKRKKKRKKSLTTRVAEAIFEGEPYDLCKQDCGYKILQELVLKYMLRGLSEADVHRIWNERLIIVKNVWDHAIRYINDNPDGLAKYENVHVHIVRPNGKRNNQILSIKRGYRNARKRNTDRLIRRAETVNKSVIKDILKTEPERICELQQRTQKLLT